MTVPTDGTNDWGNEIPRTDEIKSLFQAIIDDDPLPGEEREDTTPSSTSSTTTAPTSSTPPAATSVEAMSAYNISVDVSNASGVAGQAATIADSLAAYGFQISTVGNFSAATGLANAQASTTVVRYAAGYEAEAVTVASSIPGAVLVLAPSMGDMIEVVVGSNFAGTVVAPADPGTILRQIRRRSTPAPRRLCPPTSPASTPATPPATDTRSFTLRSPGACDLVFHGT